METTTVNQPIIQKIIDILTINNNECYFKNITVIQLDSEYCISLTSVFKDKNNDIMLLGYLCDNNLMVKQDEFCINIKQLNRDISLFILTAIM
jgi:hypothetical protein